MGSTHGFSASEGHHGTRLAPTTRRELTGRAGTGTRGPRAGAHIDRENRKPRRAGLSHQADARTRTGDPFITSEVLYQLSYVGKGRPEG